MNPKLSIFLAGVAVGVAGFLFVLSLLAGAPAMAFTCALVIGTAIWSYRDMD